MKYVFIFSFFTLLVACNNESSPKADGAAKKMIGSVERIDPALDAIISANAKAEIIADSFDWSEGPLWVEKYHMLLFSDVPQNTVYKWTEEKGKEVYLMPSGYTDTTIKRGGEMGSNGLLLDNDGNLVLCQDGDRRMGRMNSSPDMPKPSYSNIADHYNGKRFSSPNDAVYNAKGELFFTDPPYGLEKQADDPKKETIYNGVYKVKTNGQVILLLDSITRPNGIALFPGEKKLLIANSDPAKPNWYIYDIEGTDSLKNGRIFNTVAGYDKSLKGLPDGMKIDKNGNVIASGPGGIYFFNSEGKLLGKFNIPDNPASNCALSADQKTLYVTNDMNVLRIKMRD
ncbi:MAG: SMP-30/gluconolactonase/LRE family protein [Chitinophagaceae bacterium]